MTTTELAVSPDATHRQIDETEEAYTRAPRKSPVWLPIVRPLTLVALGALAIPLYALCLPVLSAATPNWLAFGGLLLGITAFYALACALVWRRMPMMDRSRKWRWIELAIILVVGLALRAVVFGAPPLLSHDAYRYAWDPYLIVHGFSPYEHTPLDPALIPLRDHAIWPNLRFRTAPTIYPPAAEYLFLLAYLFAPLNIFGVKAMIVLCDVLSAILTLLLLRQRRLDLRRVLLYWWAPIPILEFANSAHVDAEAVMFTLAALLVAAQTWRGARVATGALLGLAALTKLYPLILVVALIRRRDYGLLAGLLGTLIVGYLPILVIGYGSGGFLGDYFNQRYSNEGVLAHGLNLLLIHFTDQAQPLLIAELAALALLCGLMALYRWRVGLTPAAGILALSVAWIVVSPHVFPWYIATLLPLVALYSPRNTAALACWLFTLAMPFSYVLFALVAPDAASTIFSCLFIIPCAVALLPLLTRNGRARYRAVLQKLFALPTRQEFAQVWDAIGLRVLVR